jgi:hypothetical protein
VAANTSPVPCLSSTDSDAGQPVLRRRGFQGHRDGQGGHWGGGSLRGKDCACERMVKCRRKGFAIGRLREEKMNKSRRNGVE